MTTVTSEHRRVGQQSEWQATFRSTAGALVNPTVVTFHWKLRDVAGEGDLFVYGTDAEVTNPSVGVFVFTSPVYAVSGTYAVRCVSETPAAAFETTIDVLATLFAPVPPPGP